MKNVINFFKKYYDLVKGWVVSNGITGIAALVAGLGLWAFGYKIWAGVALGIFATRNWDIFVEWVKSVIKK